MTSLASQFKLQMLEKQPISLCEPDQKNTWLTKKIFQMTPQVVEKSVNFFSYFQEQIHPDDPTTQLTDGNRQKWSWDNLCRQKWTQKISKSIYFNYFSKSSVFNEILTALKSKRSR